jgi:hypothetical protein
MKFRILKATGNSSLTDNLEASEGAFRVFLDRGFYNILDKMIEINKVLEI